VVTNASITKARFAEAAFAIVTALTLALFAGVARADTLDELPAEFSLLSTHHALFTVPGSGDQIYQCTSANGALGWQLVGIDATLFDTDGHVFAKQNDIASWVASDGSKLSGSVAGVAAARGTSLPDQLYQVRVDVGGAFGFISNVVRASVTGGSRPAQACESAQSQKVRVPFKAEYVFYEPAA
jgi:hypothetical protein